MKLCDPLKLEKLGCNELVSIFTLIRGWNGIVKLFILYLYDTTCFRWFRFMKPALYAIKHSSEKCKAFN